MSSKMTTTKFLDRVNSEKQFFDSHQKIFGDLYDSNKKISSVNAVLFHFIGLFSICKTVLQCKETKSIMLLLKL